MAYKKIGVFGATGNVGQQVTRALVEQGFEVVPFSRRSTTVADVPTQQLGSLVGFDAIVCTTGHQGMQEQIPLIEQARRDGVKRFVPSEWGTDHRIAPVDFAKAKMHVFKAVEEAKFPDGWTAIGCGFIDFCIALFIKHNPASSTVTVAGSGNTPYPWTLGRDLGRVLAHTFKHPNEYKDTWLTVANGWYSLDEITHKIQKKSGSNWPITHRELDYSAPFLRYVEVEGVDCFRDFEVTKNLPVALSDLDESLPTFPRT